MQIHFVGLTDKKNCQLFFLNKKNKKVYDPKVRQLDEIQIIVNRRQISSLSNHFFTLQLYLIEKNIQRKKTLKH